MRVVITGANRGLDLRWLTLVLSVDMMCMLATAKTQESYQHFILRS